MGFGLLLMLFTAVLPILIIGGVVFLIVRAVSNRNVDGEYKKEDGENMLKNIYTYLVLFATLMMTIGGSVGVFMGVADYVVPNPYVESYETYRNSSTYNQTNYDSGVNIITPGEDTIRENYEHMKEEAYEKAQRSALKLILQSTGWIVIPLPVFIYYQKQNSEKKSNGLANA